MRLNSTVNTVLDINYSQEFFAGFIFFILYSALNNSDILHIYSLYKHVFHTIIYQRMCFAKVLELINVSYLHINFMKLGV